MKQIKVKVIPNAKKNKIVQDEKGFKVYVRHMHDRLSLATSPKNL